MALLCDQYYVDEFSLTFTYKLTFKIWLKPAQWFLRKQVNFLYVIYLGPRSRNDLYHKFSQIFINSIVFRSGAIVFEGKTTTFFQFFLQKSVSNNIGHCRGIGQGQSSAII